MPPQLLIVDDDSGLSLMLRDYLQNEGFACRIAPTAAAMFDALASGSSQLVILDVTLPDENGLTALRRLRAASRTPVIMLTAPGADIDGVLGLQFGADDYVSKPFNPRELVARVRAVLRRTEMQPGITVPVIIDELEIYPGTRRFVLAGHDIALTSTEFNVLEVLARFAGQPVSRDALYRQALAREAGPHDRSVDVHIASLRRKLGEWPDGTERIATVRGVGYVLTVFSRK